MTTTIDDKTTTTINARIPANLAETLNLMAADDDRSLSSMIGVALKRGVAVLLRDAERFPAAAQFAGLGSGPPTPPVQSVPGEGPPAS